jgi:hypothetical protein
MYFSASRTSVAAFHIAEEEVVIIIRIITLAVRAADFIHVEVPPPVLIHLQRECRRA